MSNKIIAIGDVHGRDTWKKIVQKEQDADRIIFIGDYWDSFDLSFGVQYENFMAILDYKIANPDKVVLLIGNHDYHYMSGVSEHYSGYQGGEYADVIQGVMDSALKDGLLQMAYEENGYLFTHAGVTNTWSLNYEIGLDQKFIAHDINIAFQEAPEIFGFTPDNMDDNWGNSVTQSPIWVRPDCLIEDKIGGFTQVVGHTWVRNGVQILEKEDVILIDTASRGDYLIIEGGLPSIGQSK